MMFHSSCRLVNLMNLAIKIMLLVSFTHGKSCEDVIPTKVGCKISILEDEKAKINVTWYVSDTAFIGLFKVSCDCLFSGFVGEIKYNSADTTRTPTYVVYQHSMELPNAVPCYDECQCRVYPLSRCFLFWNKSSDPVTCHIGPSAPKAPPVITSPPKRIISNDHFGSLVQVNFTLPQMTLFCDTYANIKNITVSITQSDNGAYQYHYNQLETLENNDGHYIYTFEFLAEEFQFWEPFNIAIAVSNSAMSTPFSDYVTIKKNDIIRSTSDYTFHCKCDFNADPSIYVLYLYWNLSDKVQHMLNSHFITGFQFTMEQIGIDDDVTTYYMKDTNLTLNLSLKPNEWYLLVGTILLVGNEGRYRPEPFYIFFRTSRPASKATQTKSSNDDDDGDDDDNHYTNKYLIGFVLIIGCLSIVIILLVVYISRTTCKKPSNISNHHEYGNDDDNSAVEPGVMPSVGSYLECKEEPSEVEN